MKPSFVCLHSVMRIVAGAALVCVIFSVTEAQSNLQSQAQSTTPSASGESCGADTFSFGCHAYLIGGGEGASPRALAAKGVQSVTLDPSHVSAGTVAELNKSGPIPIFYTNAFWQASFGGGRPSRCLSNGVASQYRECMIDPRSPEFYPHFLRQLDVVKRLGGVYIEIDNMDAYVQGGFTNDIVRLIQLAASRGINVMSKNEASPAILRLPNVVGAIVEAGARGSAVYRNGFNSVGKRCAGVVMINASESKSSDPYVSYTTGNHPNYQTGTCSGAEYTKFCGCTPNSAGPRVAGTPIATGNESLSQAPYPSSGGEAAQPGAFARSSPSGSWGSPSTALSPAGAASSPSLLPQARTGCADNPYCTNTTLGQTLFTPLQTPGLSTSSREISATKKDVDELFGASDAASEEGTVPEPDPHERDVMAKVTCVPRQTHKGGAVTVAWRCPLGTTARGRSSQSRSAFNTHGKRFGTSKITVVAATTFTVSCESDSDGSPTVTPAACTVSLVPATHATQNSAAPYGAGRDSFSNTVSPPSKPESARVCFLGFCL